MLRGMAKPFTISGTQTGRDHKSPEAEVPSVPLKEVGKATGGTHKTARDLPSSEQQNVRWPEDGPRKDALDARQSRTQKPFRVK